MGYLKPSLIECLHILCDIECNILSTEKEIEAQKIVAVLAAHTVKRLPAMRETWVRFLGQEDTLEKEMAIHSSNSCLENPMDGGA